MICYLNHVIEPAKSASWALPDLCSSLYQDHNHNEMDTNLGMDLIPVRPSDKTRRSGTTAGTCITIVLEHMGVS